MNAPDFPSLWNLPANPVFRRHAVSRLRFWRLAGWFVISQVVTGFIWTVVVLGYLHTQNHGAVEFDLTSPMFRRLVSEHGTNAFLSGWLAVLVIQGVLVVLKGTFSVATGVAREANEGMIESQRLSPLPTGHKVVGQLLGLPLLENVLALMLLPWALASAWLGDLSGVMMAKVYLIFATSTMFHHAVGLVAGTLIRQKILAGTISQVLVILLHFVLPFTSGFGIGLISHLGMESAVIHEIVAATPTMVEPHGFLPSDVVPAPVNFFRWEVALSGYHWMITVTALAALLTILLRRWSDADSQLLGKIGTLLLAAWMLVLTCGELLPGFASGQGLSSVLGDDLLRELRVGGASDEARQLLVGVVWIAGFALMLCWINLMLNAGLVPSREARARVRHQGRAPLWSDGRSAVPWVLAISLLAAGAWSHLVGTLIRETPALRSVNLEETDMAWMAASMVVPAMAAYALVLWRGWKVAMFTAFLGWIVPLMIAVVGSMLSVDVNTWPKWLAGMSGLLLPAYGVFAEIAAVPLVDCRPAFHVSLAFHSVAAVTFLLLARRSSSALRSAAAVPLPVADAAR